MTADDFITEFSQQLRLLIPHDFIAKMQSNYLKKCKEELKHGEYLIICDFSENYTFVIQVISLSLLIP